MLIYRTSLERFVFKETTHTAEPHVAFLYQIVYEKGTSSC